MFFPPICSQLSTFPGFMVCVFLVVFIIVFCSSFLYLNLQLHSTTLACCFWVHHKKHIMTTLGLRISFWQRQWTINVHLHRAVEIQTKIQHLTENPSQNLKNIVIYFSLQVGKIDIHMHGTYFRFSYINRKKISILQNYFIVLSVAKGEKVQNILIVFPW